MEMMDWRTCAKVGELSPRLGGENGMERNEKNNFRISFPSLSFFGSLSGREWNGWKEHSFLSTFLKSQIFIPPGIGRIGRE